MKIIMVSLFLLFSTNLYAINGLDQDLYLQCDDTEGSGSRVYYFSSSDGIMYGASEATYPTPESIITTFGGRFQESDTFNDFYVKLIDGRGLGVFNADATSIVIAWSIGDMRIDRTNGNQNWDQGVGDVRSICELSDKSAYDSIVRYYYDVLKSVVEARAF